MTLDERIKEIEEQIKEISDKIEPLCAALRIAVVALGTYIKMKPTLDAELQHTEGCHCDSCHAKKVLKKITRALGGDE